MTKQEELEKAREHADRLRAGLREEFEVRRDQMRSLIEALKQQGCDSQEIGDALGLPALKPVDEEQALMLALTTEAERMVMFRVFVQWLVQQDHLDASVLLAKFLAGQAAR